MESTMTITKTNTETNIWTAKLSALGTAYACATSVMVKDRPASDAFGAVERINVGISAWRPPVC